MYDAFGNITEENHKRERFHVFAITFVIITSLIGIFCFCFFNLNWISYILLGIGIVIGIVDYKYYTYQRHQINRKDLYYLFSDILSHEQWRRFPIEKQKEIIEDLLYAANSSRHGGEITGDAAYALESVLEDLNNYREE